jgi:putative Ca2+/H+ antiporter (TMEM165/GDT1 family)
MRFASLLSLSLLLSGTVAIYPPPVDPLDETDAEGLVMIQNSEGLSEDINTDGINSLTRPKTRVGGLKDSIADASNSKSNGSDVDAIESSEALSPFHSFYLAISMIVVSEIGDKTFLIAAIMAMRHPHMVVFSAAASALVLMTILSGAIGQILPHLLSPTVTRICASVLFLVFGINLIREGLATSKDQGVEEELAEVEEEIAAVEMNELSGDLENNMKSEIKETFASRIKTLASYVSSPIWVQTFSMTFLGEWGDRSQITTIAMAAGSHWEMVILGGSLGHMICTLIAVLGGQFISTKISLRTVLFGGAIAFFIFSGLYGYSAIYE